MQTQSQNFLFFEMALISSPKISAREKSAKRAIDKLLKLRRELAADDNEHLTVISDAVNKIRSELKATDSQIEEKILYAIEMQGAGTLTEIADDCRMDKKAVKNIVEELQARQIIKIVRRVVPGADKPQYLIKSVRMKLPEAG